jgi:hypothetical protein
VGVWGCGRCGGWGVWVVWGCGVTPYVRHSTDCTCCDFGHLRFLFTGITFHSLLSRFLQNKGPDMNAFIVIVDVKDAFGSVQHSKLSETLLELTKRLPNHLYIHNLKYSYTTSRKIVHRKFVSTDLQLRSKDVPILDGAKMIGDENPKKIDVKKSLKIVAKRCQLQTIQLRIGQKRRNYLVSRGIVQVSLVLVLDE